MKNAIFAVNNEPLVPWSLDDPTMSILWAMRMLTRIKGGSEFLGGRGFSDDALAEKLGLGHWVDSECTTTRLQALRNHLQMLEDWSARTSPEIPASLVANLDRLGELVGLNSIERRLVAFVAMLHCDPILENAALHSGGGDRNALHVTLAHVLRMDATDINGALRPCGNLLKSGLLTISSGSSLTLEDRIKLMSRRFADALMHPVDDVVDLLAHAVSRCAASTLGRKDYVHIEGLLEILVPHLSESLAGGRVGVNFLVYGRPGTGKSELARVLAAEVGAPAFEIASEGEDAELLFGEKRLQAYRLAQSMLGARQALLVFDEAEDVFRESSIGMRGSAAQSHKAWMNRMLEENRVPTVWICNSTDGIDPAFVRRFDGVIELGVPARVQRKQLVQRYAETW